MRRMAQERRSGEAIRLVAERRRTTRVLVLTSFPIDESVFPAIKAGARLLAEGFRA
jgi:DNA-binding NarL/FixJ family response regulator